MMSILRNTLVRSAPLLALLHVASAPATEPAARSGNALHNLRVSASATPVNVTRRNRQRSAFTLPALDYAFELTPTCADNFTPEQISLTVADSRRIVDVASLTDTGSDAAINLTVPANQLPPLIVIDFCQPSENAGTESAPTAIAPSITVPATFSANASLLCVSDSQQTMVYTSTPLEVQLVCVADESDAAGESAE